MKRIGYSLIDAQGAEAAFTRSLPWSPAPPGKPLGRLATFTAVGQTADGYTVVERHETEPEHPIQVPGTPSVAFDGTKIVVNRNWTYPSLDTCKAQRVADIKQDAQDRIMALVGVDDIIQCLIKQSNANMRANELNDIRNDREWTVEEAAEAAALRGLATAIKAIRAQSNTLEDEVLALKDAAAVATWGIVWP
jgi:hypothetical protein